MCRKVGENYTGAFCKIVPMLRMAPSSFGPPPVFSNISKMCVLPFPSSPGYHLVKENAFCFRELFSEMYDFML